MTWQTHSEFCAHYHCSSKWAGKLAYEPGCPAVKLGNRWRWPQPATDQWLQARETVKRHAPATEPVRRLTLDELLAQA